MSSAPAGDSAAQVPSFRQRLMVLAIALVQVGGIATFVMSLSTYDSLLLTRDRYYRDQRFAQVFASLKRAPDTLAGRIRALPGVDQVQTRVVAAIRSVNRSPSSRPLAMPISTWGGTTRRWYC